MSMTREEAIERLERLKRSCRDLAAGMPEELGWALHGMALDMGITALRPVSREQVEKVFPGCPYCKEDGDGYVQKFGAYSIHSGELTTGHCKPQKIKFCPHCSRPLTDEAVQMVMERLEALYERNDD